MSESRSARRNLPDLLGPRRALLVALSIVAASCGGSDDSATTSSLVVVGEASPASSSPAPAPAPAPEDENEAAVATSDGTDASDTTGATDVSEPSAAAGGEERLPLRTETPLVAGAYRTNHLASPALDIEIDLPVDGLYAFDEEGALSISQGTSGERTLVTIFHLDNGLVLQPTVDPTLFADRAYLESVSEKSPPDILDWFEGRPGVTVGPVADDRFGGIPSRSRTVVFGPFDGAVPCLPADERPCHWLVFAPVTGLAFLQNVGDELVVHEVTVAGHRLLVLVDATIDPDTAGAIASSIRFSVVPHPAAPAGSEPMPVAGTLIPGTVYVHERSTGGIWLVEGATDVEVADGFLRDRFVRLRSGDDECLSLTDASQGFWWGVPAGPDGEPTGDPLKMTTDLATLIDASDGLEVVAGPTDVQLGDVVGVSYDVRPIGTDDVVLATTSIIATAGEVNRVIGAPRTDGSGADLAVVTLGSACEAMLDGLVFIPGAER